MAKAELHRLLMVQPQLPVVVLGNKQVESFYICVSRSRMMQDFKRIKAHEVLKDRFLPFYLLSTGLIDPAVTINQTRAINNSTFPPQLTFPHPACGIMHESPCEAGISVPSSASTPQLLSVQCGERCSQYSSPKKISLRLKFPAFFGLCNYRLGIDYNVIIASASASLKQFHATKTAKIYF